MCLLPCRISRSLLSKAMMMHSRVRTAMLILPMLRSTCIAFQMRAFGHNRSLSGVSLAFLPPSLSTLVTCTTQDSPPYGSVGQETLQLGAAEDKKVVRRNMHGARVKATRVCEICFTGPVWGGCSACVEVDGGSVVPSACADELLPSPDMEVPV
jgi:hypothetical protein